VDQSAQIQRVYDENVRVYGAKSEFAKTAVTPVPGRR
jgi:hypothetical protein